MRYERRRPSQAWPWSADTMTDMADAWNDWANEMAGAFDSFMNSMTDAPGRRKRPHRKPPKKGRSSCCGDCYQDTCHCDCCVYDADLIVYTRVGERRVVPVRITNERTRKRNIALDLSEFTTSGGSPAPVSGQIVTAKEFELEACEREDVVIVVAIADDDTVTATKAELTEMVTAGRITETKQPDRSERLKLPDVDDCMVAYADLRIQGCDVRPLRIAVAVLPRDCDAHEVHCACGCC